MHKALFLLRKIPRGSVTTYKELARLCNTSPRAIGRIMASNSDPGKYPCYKVIHADGRVGNYSAKGGCIRKMQLLKKDGVEVVKEKIKLDKYIHRF